MELEKTVKDIFKDIIDKYNMQYAVISRNEVVLFTDKYILSFLYHNAELDLLYYEKKEDGEVYEYDIDSFIASSIAEEDRVQIIERLKEETDLVIELELCACTLERKWKDLLLGGKEWIKEYQKFFLSSPARNVTEIIEEYRGICI